MEGEKRRWGWRHKATGGMTPACGRGICHILSGNRTSERYSIASAVLGSWEHASTGTHTQPNRPSQAYLALHGCTASTQNSRSCQQRPGSFWTVSLNAMSLPVMEWWSHSLLLPWDGKAHLIGVEKCVFGGRPFCPVFVSGGKGVWWREAETEPKGTSWLRL